MSYFVPLDEDTIMQIWQQDPTLVMPFARPFLPANHVANHVDSLVGNRVGSQTDKQTMNTAQEELSAQNTGSGSTCLPTLQASSA